MYHATSWKQRISLFFTILLPILITQISYSLMTMFDTMMSGHAGTGDLAGVAIGASLWMPVSIGLNGILMAITPMIAQLLGRKEKGQIARTVTQALYLSVLLAVVITGVGVVLLQPVLSMMHLEADVYRVATRYLGGLCIGIIPLFASNVIRYFFDAQGYTKISMSITVIAVPFNVLLNYLLIFGNWGFPKMGGVGAGYATGLTYWFILLLSVGVVFRVEATRGYKLFIQWYTPSWRMWKEQLSIGVPMGLSIFFEASIFSIVTLLMGSMYDTSTVAAHQSAINFTSMLFMMPLSIASTLTILVAFEVGSGRLEGARAYSRFGVSTAIGLLGITAVFLYLFREQVAMLYSNDPKVISLMMHFLVFGVFYQLSDAAQASLQGVLRGYKDTAVPFMIALAAYWGVGLPAGYAFAAWTSLGAYGFWVGIIAGLTGAAAGFAMRLAAVQRKARRELQRA
ncbi:MATE family efflux transporter [Paenibacillus protaetiae]|uniref:Probable multidrug resistance protein NorM n=1 Tax=Paenibacillus protaetiae TaxID=2509456 RepID=A0A4P6EX58_9BACL|nr:MATE family efflux transporter [Paenibacillus protaetiae]QAY67622.1 MATE family efflux transporter [Paenibacillus protaetiae]